MNWSDVTAITLALFKATSSNPIIISFDVNNASRNYVLKPMVDETNIWWKRKHGNEKGATQRTCLLIEPGRGRSKPAQYIKVFCIFTYACVLVYAVPKIPGLWSVEFHRNSLSNLQKTFPFFLILIPYLANSKYCENKHLNFSLVNLENQRRKHCLIKVH